MTKEEYKMTKEEYAAWQKETIRSKNNWLLDEITLRNKGEYLFYKGGESGTYINIKKDGISSVGYYENAIPHIGEAPFHQKHIKKLEDSAEEALKIVVEKMGIPFLMNFVKITF